MQKDSELWYEKNWEDNVYWSGIKLTEAKLEINSKTYSSRKPSNTKKKNGSVAIIRKKLYIYHNTRIYANDIYRLMKKERFPLTNQ